MMNKNQDYARVFKAFCDENRLEILNLLKHKDMCGNDILDKMSISQSTLSHHMKILIDADIVCAIKDGKKTIYSLCIEGIKNSKQILNEIIGE